MKSNKLIDIKFEWIYHDLNIEPSIYNSHMELRTIEMRWRWSRL